MRLQMSNPTAKTESTLNREHKSEHRKWSMRAIEGTSQHSATSEVIEDARREHPGRHLGNRCSIQLSYGAMFFSASSSLQRRSNSAILISLHLIT
jgi:hypothetical protein